MTSAEEKRTIKLSIIIPTLNEENSISQTLSAVERIAEPVEVIVVDGRSHDETAGLVRAHGVKFIQSERGRGVQLHAGACAAQGAVLWFLHADTIPPPDAVKQIVEALQDPTVVGGNFDVRFDSHRLSAHCLTWFYRYLRIVGLCYGDSAIFVRREAYERSGGFKSLPIFEDLDFLRRLKRMGRFGHLSCSVITSGRRFEEGRFVSTFIRWVVLQLLYWLGVNPSQLVRLYAPVRQAGKEPRISLVRNSFNHSDIYADRRRDR
ncbi:MAG: TIGR04283 family arsenosugar biosynthesis glycosyltransferase [Acidobacteria bacterium]|nr:TIGR04283 family arsenosugar biosynthesis glycosyltransferase [Acidobacteriota bacterium]